MVRGGQEGSFSRLLFPDLFTFVIADVNESEDVPQIVSVETDAFRDWHMVFPLLKNVLILPTIGLVFA
jgi:hypothetical protein